MSWKPGVEELRRREVLADEVGGDEKVDLQHSRGKLDVRERIRRLIDLDSFYEIGKIAGRADYDEEGHLAACRASNFVFGRARVDGRPVIVAGDDFPVRGRAADTSIHGKQAMAERLANELRLPIVRLMDGTGGGSVEMLDAKRARTYVPVNLAWDTVVDNPGEIPVVALGLGPVAGLGAARRVSFRGTTPCW